MNGLATGNPPLANRAAFSFKRATAQLSFVGRLIAGTDIWFNRMALGQPLDKSWTGQAFLFALRPCLWFASEVFQLLFRHLTGQLSRQRKPLALPAFYRERRAHGSLLLWTFWRHWSRINDPNRNSGGAVTAQVEG